MSYSSRRLTRGSATNGRQVARAIHDACQDPIRAHIRQLNQEKDLGRLLQLMQPAVFEEMARRACRDASQIVVSTTQEFQRLGGIAAGYGRTVPSCPTIPEVMGRLGPQFNAFARILQHYACEYERFSQLVADANGGVARRSFAAGCRGMVVGSGLFGPLGGLAMALAQGYLIGKSADKALEAGGERLDRAFREMIGAWDDAIGAVLESALDILRSYLDRLEAAGCLE